MRNPILAITISFMVAVPCTVASAQSYQGNIKVEGAKQGKFKGETSPPTTSGGTTPRDISSGQATGRRQYKPATILEESSGPGSSNGKPTSKGH